MWPHRRQTTRLPCPWDSPGKNAGVGCHFLLQCRKMKSEVKSLSHVWLLATPWTAAYQAPPSMGFSRQEYWSGVPLPSALIFKWESLIWVLQIPDLNVRVQTGVAGQALEGKGCGQVTLFFLRQVWLNFSFCLCPDRNGLESRVALALLMALFSLYKHTYFGKVGNLSKVKCARTGSKL